MVRTSTSRTQQTLPRSLPERWRSAILDSLTLALARLTDTGQPAARRIRKSRQATKVARALLRLAPRGVKRQALGARMALSSVAKRLAGVRDADSLAETLALAAAEAKTSKAALAALMKPLSARRSALDSHEAKALTDATAILTRLIRQIEGWKPPAGGAAALLQAGRDDYRRLRRKARDIGPQSEIETLHEARRRTILHRHQWAFFATLAERKSAGDRLARRALKLKDLHQALGRHRDLALLDAYLRPLGNPRLHGAIERLLAAILRMQEREVRLAQELAGRLVKRKPGAMLARLEALLSP